VRELLELGAAMIVTAPAGEYLALLETLTERLAAARAQLA
jgi:hypothetical protein